MKLCTLVMPVFLTGCGTGEFSYGPSEQPSQEPQSEDWRGDPVAIEKADTRTMAGPPVEHEAECFMREGSSQTESHRTVECWGPGGQVSNGPEGEPARATRLEKYDGSVYITEQWRDSRNVEQVTINEIYDWEGNLTSGNCKISGPDGATYAWDEDGYFEVKSFERVEIQTRPLECFLYYEYFGQE